MKEIFADKSDSATIEIYATLSNKQYALVQNGEAELEIPSHTEMTNKAGSKGLYFSCYGKRAAVELTEGLDASAIAWQEVYLGEDLAPSMSSLELPFHQSRQTERENE